MVEEFEGTIWTVSKKGRGPDPLDPPARCAPAAAGILFNKVLGDIDFKLTGLILKAFWPFPNETDATRI